MGHMPGHILIADVVKPHSIRAIDELKKQGIATVMLTGDAKQVAEKVAQELGISRVYSELLPEDKVTLLEKITQQKNGNEKVLFVGDGINDAPVLSLADVGIAMGAMGSDAAIEAADVVLMDDDPLKIGKAIRISKKCVSIVHQNIYFAHRDQGDCPYLGGVGPGQYVDGHFCRYRRPYHGRHECHEGFVRKKGLILSSCRDL